MCRPRTTAAVEQADANVPFRMHLDLSLKGHNKSARASPWVSEASPWVSEASPWVSEASPWVSEASPWGSEASPWVSEASPWGSYDQAQHSACSNGTPVRKPRAQPDPR